MEVARSDGHVRLTAVSVQRSARLTVRALRCCLLGPARRRRHREHRRFAGLQLHSAENDSALRTQIVAFRSPTGRTRN
jgi:hypothetical protein